MPVKRCDNGRYRIGDGPCVYTSKAKATRAYRAYLAKQSEDFSTDIEVDAKAYLDTLDADELLTLQHHVERLHDDAQHNDGTVITEAKLPTGIDFLTSRHYRSVNRAASALEKGKITADEFRTKVKAATTDTFTKAYAKGKGVKVSELTDGDREYLRRATETELEYLDGFADDLANKRTGKPGKMSRQRRANMYAQSVEGIAWHGSVEAQPDDVEIRWVLGEAEHCCTTSNLVDVITVRGIIPLKDVRVGDRVLTHRSRWRPVVAKMEHASKPRHQYAVLVGVGGRLFGLTTDHQLYTERGWLAAQEAARSGIKTIERKMSSLWEAMPQSRRSMQGMLRGPGEQQAICGRVEMGGFQDSCFGWPGVCGLSDEGWCKDQGGTGEMGLGAGQRSDPRRTDHSPQEPRSIRRQVGKFGDDHQRQAQQDTPRGCSVGEGQPELEGWKDRVCLRGMRRGIQGVSEFQEPGSVLFTEMQCRIDKGPCCTCVRSVWQEVRTHPRQDQIGQEEWQQEGFVLSQLLQEDERRGGSDPAVRLLRQEVCALEVGDQRVEVGQVLLLKGVLEQGTRLYDITVEEDHSFVAGGCVISNSDCLLLSASSPFDRLTLPTTPRAGSTQCRTRCKCKLEFKTGKKQTPQDAAELEYKKDASLSELMDPPVPPGTRKPSGTEQRHIDNLRTKMNYQRRRIAKEQEAVKRARSKAARAAAQDRLRDAISLRKGYNRQLIEFNEKNDIFEVPVFSVDDVITEKDIGNRARRDIMRSGLDGGSLSLLEAKTLGRLLREFEEQVGDNLSDAAVARAIGEAAELKQSAKIDFMDAPHALRGKNNRLAVNLVADGLERMHLLVSSAVRAARGTDVIVGPFDGRVLGRVGLWLEGDPDEVDEVLKRMRGV